MVVDFYKVIGHYRSSSYYCSFTSFFALANCSRVKIKTFLGGSKAGMSQPPSKLLFTYFSLPFSPILQCLGRGVCPRLRLPAHPNLQEEPPTLNQTPSATPIPSSPSSLPRWQLCRGLSVRWQLPSRLPGRVTDTFLQLFLWGKAQFIK